MKKGPSNSAIWKDDWSTSGTARKINSMANVLALRMVWSARDPTFPFPKLRSPDIFKEGSSLLEWWLQTSRHDTGDDHGHS
jgi:hypothetical protein